MKKLIYSVWLFAMCLLINSSGCKSDKLIQPTPVGSQQEPPSTDPLINYLSIMSNVPASMISFDHTSNNFIIKNNVKISKPMIESSYKKANEFKLKNGITKID